MIPALRMILPALACVLFVAVPKGFSADGDEGREGRPPGDSLTDEQRETLRDAGRILRGLGDDETARRLFGMSRGGGGPDGRRGRWGRDRDDDGPRGGDRDERWESFRARMKDFFEFRNEAISLGAEFLALQNADAMLEEQSEQLRQYLENNDLGQEAEERLQRRLELFKQLLTLEKAVYVDRFQATIPGMRERIQRMIDRLQTDRDQNPDFSERWDSAIERLRALDESLGRAAEKEDLDFEALKSALAAIRESVMPPGEGHGDPGQRVERLQGEMRYLRHRLGQLESELLLLGADSDEEGAPVRPWQPKPFAPLLEPPQGGSEGRGPMPGPRGMGPPGDRPPPP